MIHVDELGARVIVAFGDGSVFLSESILWGFILAAILAVLGWDMDLKRFRQPKDKLPRS